MVKGPTYPVWLPYEFEERPERITEVITTKAAGWNYEKEFRLIFPTRDDFFSLPPDSLKGVIIGAQASPEVVEIICDIVTRHAPALRIRRAVLMPRQYKLSCQQVPVRLVQFVTQTAMRARPVDRPRFSTATRTNAAFLPLSCRLPRKPDFGRHGQTR